MVLRVISSKGEVMLLFYFEESRRVDADTYILVINTLLKPWMEGVAGVRHYIFQKDGVPAQNADETQAWLEKNLKQF